MSFEFVLALFFGFLQLSFRCKFFCAVVPFCFVLAGPRFAMFLLFCPFLFVLFCVCADSYVCFRREVILALRTAARSQCTIVFHKCNPLPLLGT